MDNLLEKRLIEFLVSEGITVKTNTKARGHQGIYFKNRIDVSKKLEKGKRIRVLVHEYAHKVHHEIEENISKTGGTLQKLFNQECNEHIAKELVKVTNLIDEQSNLYEIKQKETQLKAQMKELELLIQLKYPHFKRSYPFKEADEYFKKSKSNAKYLLKFDNVRLITPFLKREKFYSINDIDTDFKEVPEHFRVYIKLKSVERKYKRVCRVKNKAKKYYSTPTELFARFVEGIFFDKEEIQKIAPHSTARFLALLDLNHYGNLKTLFDRFCS